MARQRRGGFRPPEIKGTLGTLLRTTWQQAGVVREVLERGAREGRARLDDALAGRRRQDALAELGELVLDLIRRGEIDLAELPEAEPLVRALDELDAEAGADFGDDAEGSFAHAPTRRRFDERAGAGSSGSSRGGFGSRSGSRGDRDREAGDDGTVSSSRWSPPSPRRSAAPTRVWRPTAVDDEPASHTAPEPPSPAPAPRRKGGIRFEDDSDDDLADYMHPDDVPPKDGDR